MKNETTAVRGGNQITDGVIWKSLLLFFFPMLFGTFFQMLYNTTDSVVVGRFVGVNALSAIGGASAMIVNVVVGAFTGLTSGATVIISQYFGARNEKNVSEAVHTAIAFALLFGLAFTVGGVLLARPMLEAMNTPAETMDGSTVYLVVYFIGLVPNLLYNVGASILRAIGDSKRPLYFLIVSCLTNVVLDVLFVAVFHMGVFGAALATILCQALSAVMVLYVLLKTEECYKLEIRKIRISGRQLRKILKIGIPAMIESLTYTISNVILQVVVNRYGTSYVAGWVACSKGDQIFWMISQAFGIAVTTFIGQNYGAGKFDRVRRCIRQSIGIYAGLTVICQALLLTFSKIILSMFTTDAEVLALGNHMMRFFVGYYMTYLCVEIFSAVCRGLGDAVKPMIISIVGICGLRILWVFVVLPINPDFDVMMYSYPVTWIVTSVLLTVYYLLNWVRSGRLVRREDPGQAGAHSELF